MYLEPDGLEQFLARVAEVDQGESAWARDFIATLREVLSRDVSLLAAELLRRGATLGEVLALVETAHGWRAVQAAAAGRPEGSREPIGFPP